MYVIIKIHLNPFQVRITVTNCFGRGIVAVIVFLIFVEN